jgi:hypothetical protein
VQPDDRLEAERELVEIFFVEKRSMARGFSTVNPSNPARAPSPALSALSSRLSAFFNRLDDARHCFGLSSGAASPAPKASRVPADNVFIRSVDHARMVPRRVRAEQFVHADAERLRQLRQLAISGMDAPRFPVLTAPESSPHDVRSAAAAILLFLRLRNPPSNSTRQNIVFLLSNPRLDPQKEPVRFALFHTPARQHLR